MNLLTRSSALLVVKRDSDRTRSRGNDFLLQSVSGPPFHTSIPCFYDTANYDISVTGDFLQRRIR